MTETRKEFIYRMLALINEVQDKPNLTTNDIVSLLELHLHNRERGVAIEFKRLALKNFSLSGLHKNSFIQLDEHFNLILTKF